MSALPSSNSARLLVSVALCLFVVGAVLTAGGTAQQDPTNRTEVTQSLTIGLSNFPADGEPRTVYVSVPDNLAGTVSVDSVEARGAGLEPSNARVVDGPDGDGQFETVAVDVRATGDGAVSGRIGVAVVATYPELTEEEAGNVVVGGVSGSAEYAVDDSDPLFQRVLENSNTSLTSLASAESILAVTPPERVVVEGVSSGLSTDDLSVSVPLERLGGPTTLAVDPGALTFEGSTTTGRVSVTATGAERVTIGSVSLTGDADAFRTTGAPDGVDAGETKTITIEHVGDGGANATLLIESDARNLPTAVVDLTATPRSETDEDEQSDDEDQTDGDDRTDEGGGEMREPDEMEVSDRNGERRINVTVRNVSSGDSVSMSMPANGSEAGNDDVVIESMSMTAATDGDFNMSISTGQNVSASAPEMNTSDKEPLGYFSIDHEWDNDAVSNTSITVRVEKSRVDSLEDTDPEEVALYRYVDGGWQEELTEYRGETATHYRYRVFADGYSDWATAGKQPDFQIVETGLNVTSGVQIDDAVEVSVSIVNDGQADGDYETTLWLNNVKIDSREISLAPGGSGRVIFERNLNQVGTYEVRVNNVTVDQIEVEGNEETAASSQTGSGDETTLNDAADSNDGLPIWLVAVGILLTGVVVGGGVYLRTSGQAPTAPSDSAAGSSPDRAPSAGEQSETESAPDDRERS